MATLFAPYTDKGVQQPGAGAGKPNTPPATGATGADEYVRPDSVKTRVALSDDLKKSGIKAGTAEYTAALTKHGEGLPLR